MRTTFDNMNCKAVYVNRSVLSLMMVLVLTIAGCSRCENCESTGSSETICESEFDSVQQYEDAVAEAEANGATCTSTGGF